MPTTWYPCGLLNGTPTQAYALIVLNQPVNKNALNAVIESASLLVCADAGADRLYEYDRDTKSHWKRRLPDAIVGDLDSLSPQTEDHYRKQGVTIVKEPNQYSTDFTKCLRYVRNWSREHCEPGRDAMDVVVLGGLGGRVDQGFSQIHHLYLAENDVELLKGRIFLLSEQSLSFVLAKDENILRLEPGYFQENIGIIPLLGPGLLTTQGLEWDVDNWPTEIGGQLSTSNHVRSDTIRIASQGPQPLVTLELASRFTAAN